MFEIIARLIAVLGLVAANGFFVAAEFSLVGVRRTRVDELVSQGSTTARVLQRTIDRLDDSLAATQLGVTVSSLGLGWIGESTLARLLDPLLAFLGDAKTETAHAVAIAIAFAIITVFHIVLGELVPKSIALQKPEPTALAIVRPLGLFATLLRPGILVLNGFGSAITRLFGLQGTNEENRLHSTEELKLLVAASRNAGLVNQAQQDVVERAFAMSKKRVHTIMTPRHDVDWVDVDASLESILHGMRQARHEQVVLARGSLDDVVGILRKQDLFDMHVDNKLPADEAGKASLLLAARAPLVLHDGATVTQVLDLFKQRLVQMGLVYDEYGALRGIVTRADLLEALAGEIVDTDDDSMLVRREDGAFLADGARALGDVLLQLGIDPFPLDLAEYRTFAGFVLSRMGHIPVEGETVDCEIGPGLWRIEITAMAGRRIDEVALLALSANTVPSEAG